MTAFLFPGQGSQHRGMGHALFDRVAEYRMVEDEVDRLLGYSVRQLCLNGEESVLKQTQYTQPCLFVVNCLYYFDARTGQRATAVAGHSLGEYNALMAAEVFDLLTGVEIVAHRGELMSTAQGGAMAAVLKIAPARVADVLATHALELDIASFNGPSQTVIAGPAEAIDRAAPILERAGASCVRLPVSAAFHSRWMADAAAKFARVLDGYKFSAVRLPVISNVTGQFYPADASDDAIKRLLVEQMTRPVRWMQGIEHLRQWGVTAFAEVGPGGVLSRLTQQIQQAAAAPL